MAVVEPWVTVWDFGDFLLWAPSACPLCSCSAPGTVPTPRCKMCLEFLTVALPGHKVQLQSSLHPAHAGDGIPLGILLAVFIFPSCVDLSYATRSVLCTKALNQCRKLQFKADFKFIRVFGTTITSYTKSGLV